MLVRIFCLFVSITRCFIVCLHSSSFFYVINKRRNTNKRNEGEKSSYLHIKLIHFLLTIYFMMIIFNFNRDWVMFIFFLVNIFLVLNWAFSYWSLCFLNVDWKCVYVIILNFNEIPKCCFIISCLTWTVN